MLKSGVAYRKTQIVNWDPVDNTVLANEQVVDGKGWRSGAPVEKREIPGYYLAITRYAEELLATVKTGLDGWPTQVRAMQENWIGRSEGCEISFPFAPDTRSVMEADGALKVFTTRADTLFGATFLAVAAEHPIALATGKRNPRLAAFIEECTRGAVMEAQLATQEKKGMATGLHALHPLTGQPVEIWVANYVLMGYGEGAVMGVPAHDERDFEFAHQNQLPIVQVVKSKTGAYDGVIQPLAGGLLRLRHHREIPASIPGWNSRLLSMPSPRPWSARGSAKSASSTGCAIGESRASATGARRFRSFIARRAVSCQCRRKICRSFCRKTWCRMVAATPLNKDERFLACKCPQCGKDARRETDTMDTFVDSSWYYMRYCCPDASGMIDERTDYWMPMDQYIGGIEHAVLHLLYARFWTKVMRDLGLVKFSEPFKQLFTQGMLLAHCYYREDANGRKRWFYPAEVEQQFDERGTPVSAVAKEDGKPVIYGGIEKMSKSKNNVVEPGPFIQRFGADTARAFVMFAGPPDQSAPWSDSSAEGVHRFLKKLWSFCYQNRARIAAAPPLAAAALDSGLKKLRHQLHTFLQQALFDFQRIQYNTVVSATMKMLNALDTAAEHPGSAALLREGVGILLRTLYPMTPHVAHVLWVELGYAQELGDLLNAPLPQPAEDALRQDELELVVQVNGKLRGRVIVAAAADEAAIKAAALADEHVKKFVDKPVRKVIYVPGKLINIVV